MSIHQFVLATTAIGLALLTPLAVSPLYAGVTNPNTSVIGNMVVEMTGDPADPDHDRPRLGFREAEFMFDDYLNPYTRGTVILAAHTDAVELEEAYFEIVRGLPLGLALKAGKARTDFGRLNAVHPHAYPFIDSPAMLTAYTQSEEGMNDIEIGVSRLFALPGDLASTVSFTLLQGNSFRGGHHHHGEAEDEVEEEGSDQTRLGWSGRWKNFLTIKETHPLEIGVSVAHGVNDPHEGTKTTLIGVDFKGKFYSTPRNYLTLQGEFIRASVEHFHEDEGEIETLEPSGLWASADYTFNLRYYLGAKVESFGELEDGEPGSSRIGGYCGYALLEETTIFRFLAENVKHDGADAYNRYLLQVVFSMGPHKAHQF